MAARTLTFRYHIFRLHSSKKEESASYEGRCGKVKREREKDREEERDAPQHRRSLAESPALLAQLVRPIHERREALAAIQHCID
jgi:hypothetical protein